MRWRRPGGRRDEGAKDISIREVASLGSLPIRAAWAANSAESIGAGIQEKLFSRDNPFCLQRIQGENKPPLNSTGPAPQRLQDCDPGRSEPQGFSLEGAGSPEGCLGLPVKKKRKASRDVAGRGIPLLDHRDQKRARVPRSRRDFSPLDASEGVSQRHASKPSRVDSSPQIPSSTSAAQLCQARNVL